MRMKMTKSVRKKKPVTLIEKARHYSRHGFYCQWVRPLGYYDHSLPCTCGRDAFLADLEKVLA